MNGAAQPQRRRLSRGHASFSARVVEASGAEWFLAEDDVSDPGVALDIARSLEPKLGPTVLRVTAPGDEYRRVAGDWLCDDEPFSAKSRNARVGPLVWSASAEAGRWARGVPLINAWETCERPSWMAQAAGDAGVPPRSVALAAFAVFEHHAAREASSQDTTNARIALRMLDDWKAGTGHAERLREAGSLLFIEANSENNTSARSMLAQALSDLCYAAATTITVTNRIHDVMTVAYSCTSLLALSRLHGEPGMARSFRAAMPSIVVLRSAVRRGQSRRRGR